MLRRFLLFLAAWPCLLPVLRAADGVSYQGAQGPGHGKRIVFLAGDEEYRSEEALPMLAKILAFRHGFDCRVLFTINPSDGTIDPLCKTNLPGIQALDTADLCVMLLRYRELPDDQMKHFVGYLNSGRPIIALRTSTHAFQYPHLTNSPYAKYDCASRAWPGGFGRQVLGETWVSHHGEHGKESTHGVINPALKDHPIVRGVEDLWWPTDVYTVGPLPENFQVLVWGEVLSGMKPADPPVTGPKNHPLMPLLWTREYTGESGQVSRIVTTTAGAAVDLENESLRRLLVNACYWTTGLADKLPAKANVDYVGEYHPSWFGFGKFKKGLQPADLKMDAPPQKQ
jgi:hypothetical protein